MKGKTLKQRTCKICTVRYYPTRSMQPVCSPKCAIALDREKTRKAVKRSDRERKRELKTKSDLIREAQYEFNRFIRLRDKDEPCISCQRFHQGQMHAGHYISTGAATELRFKEENCNSQCAPCNNHLSGNPIKYRINLINKVGLGKVEWLEGSHPLPNWTREELIQIKLDYRIKAKALQDVV